MDQAHGFEGDFGGIRVHRRILPETWSYVQTGQRCSETGFSLYPKFAVPGAGANGGGGKAGLAIGYFSKTAPGQVPQVLCEFKAIRSALDAEQKGKGNTRSPVRRCPDYLSFARRGMIGSEPILPTWGIVIEAEGTFILAQWKVFATAFSITERRAGKKLCDGLRKLATNDGSPVVLQIMALERELASRDAEIARQERAMNALVHGLYGLSAEEIGMVEKG